MSVQLVHQLGHVVFVVNILVRLVLRELNETLDFPLSQRDSLGRQQLFHYVYAYEPLVLGIKDTEGSKQVLRGVGLVLVGQQY